VTTHTTAPAASLESDGKGAVDGWRALELELRRRRPAAAQLAREVLGAEASVRRAALITQLSGIATTCSEQEAYFAAVLFRAGRVHATATVTMVAGDSLIDPDDVDGTLDRLEASLGGRREGDVARVVDLVMADGLPVVRARVLAGLLDDGGAALLVDLTQFWLPIPATTEAHLLTCSTTDLARADELQQEFEVLCQFLLFPQLSRPACL
jgi:hypothetical protein